MTRAIFAIGRLFGIDTKALISFDRWDWLISYWYLQKSKNYLRKLKELNRPSGYIFMLDSGAFSAWNKGIEINLWDYIDFIKKTHQYFTHIVCLDVIDDPVSSEVNHMIMQDELSHLDLQLIPVFHADESFSVLEYLISRGYGYIGISPNNNWNEQGKREWLNRVYTHFDGLKNIKTHGFGYTSIEGLSKYNLTTADSIAWLFASSYGELMTDKGRIFVSSYLSKKEKETSNLSLFDVGEEERTRVLDFRDNSFVKKICNENNISLDLLADSRRERVRFNICATINLINDEKEESICCVNNDFYVMNYIINDIETEVMRCYQIAKEQGKKYTGYLTNHLVFSE